MKKAKRNSIIALLVLVAVGFSGCGIRVGIRKPSDNNKEVASTSEGSVSEDVNEALEITDSTRVKINISVAKLTIKSTDGDKLTVVSRGNEKYGKIKVSSSGNKITIADEDRNVWPGISGPHGNVNRTVVIEIPKTFKGDMDITSGVGATTIEDISFKKVTIDGGVGSIDINNITFEDLKLKQGVGAVHMTLNKIEGDLQYEGGVGAADITIPDNSPVNIKTQSGLGKCNVSAKTSSEGKYEFDLTSGIGEISVTSH